MNAKTLAVLEFDKVRRRLADHTCFSGGRQLALALTPERDQRAVGACLARTTQARDYLDRRGAPPMGGAHDMRGEVDAAERGRTLLPQELLDIRDTVRSSTRMRRAIESRRQGWPDLAEIAIRLEPCPALTDAIGDALDEEGQVCDGASPELARLRKRLRTVRDRLVRQLEGTLSGSHVREYLQEPVITQRDGRYVLPVKSEFRSRVAGVVHGTSDSGATVFVEPMAVVEAGNQLRQIESEEEKEVTRILRSLSADVAAEADALRDSIAALAELDLAFACAHFAGELRAVEPEIAAAKAPMLDYPRARHPLLDPDTVVPVSVRAGDDFRLLVITGPNTGGKTVTLKTAGLLTLMAQAGLHIPAGDGARLTVFDDVFADIGDEQSIEQSLSTFSGHMTNIIGILDRATPRSLVLLDELGAGTDPVEGAALAESLLEHLRERQITTIASTHYSQLKVYAHATPDVANASVEFDVETLRPTFELTIGLPGRSNALAIARRLGLPEDVVGEARGRMATSELALEDMLSEIREARTAASADREAAAEAREQADQWAAKLEEAVNEMKRSRAEALNALRSQAAAELEAARETIGRLLKRAEQDATTAEAIREASRELEETAARVAEVPMEEPPLAIEVDELHPGMRVRVVSFNRTGEVLRLMDGEAEVQLGQMRVTVAVTDLEPVPEGESSAPEPALTRLVRASDSPESVPMELDLRGQRVADGLDLVDAYLNDAALSGMPFVHIIHGHGTGAMREAVRDQLRHHPLVTRYRPGERGEGGNGVTVVYLRE